jgi:1-acyl-sn-glycerol-3-phosphate acyltransferase
MNLLYRLVWISSRLIFKFLFLWRVYNPERVPLQGPAILASNHASFFDPPLVGAGLTRAIHYLGRESLFRFPIVGWGMRTVQAIPVDRDGGGAAGLRAIVGQLLAGGAILLFPEGTRTRDGNLQVARSGVGLAIIKSDAPVIPVRIFGTFEAFGRHHTIPRFFRPIAIKYGAPLWFRELREEAKRCSKARLKQIYQEVTEALMQEIGKLQPHTDKASFP